MATNVQELFYDESADDLDGAGHRDSRRRLDDRFGTNDRYRGVYGRRLRGVLDETNPADMVEYHVVGNGVDEEAIRSLLVGAFDRVDIVRYWSNQSGVALRLGRRLSLANNFGVVARGFSGVALSPAGG